ncbi:MAG: hypothetical protein ABSB12_01295 [Candidatus Saccharimonadales bacterium]|jgi:hypothetical protein
MSINIRKKRLFQFSEFILTGVTCVVLLTLTLLPIPVSAQSNGLGITPREDYTINPGQSISDKLYLSNLSSTQPLKVSVKIIDFEAANNSGTPELLIAPNAPQTAWSLKPFLTIPNTVSVTAGGSTYIPFTITIPTNQGAGSYYSAIEYAAKSVSGQGNVGVAASSATLIFVTVPGKTTEFMKLIKYGAFIPNPDGQTGQFSNWYFTSAPKELAYLLENEGNVAEKPSGSILLKNIHGKVIREINDANPNDSLALIDQTRRFEACIIAGQQKVSSTNGQIATQIICENPKLSPGRYTAELAIYYGLNGNPTQQILATTTFWYLPFWFLIIVFGGLGIIIYMIYKLIHSIRFRSR